MDPTRRALESLRAKAGRTIRIVFPEGDDDRILAAAIRLAGFDIPAKPVLLGNTDRIMALARSGGLDPASLEILDPETAPEATRYADAYGARRPGTKPALALRAVRKPMYFAGMMLASGDAQAMVGGATCPTARVIEAAMLTIGLADGVSAPSSFFIMQRETGSLVFADCAVNIAPDVDTLAAIGIASASSCRALLGLDPRVAFLSFSTHGSATHEQARKIRAAVQRARELCPSVAFDGELQVDAALDPRVAAMKVKEQGAVAGHANVLVFPDLNAANIGYKLVQYLGGAKALGPFLQGFAAPVSDLSRGATVDDIVGTAILTAARAAT